MIRDEQWKYVHYVGQPSQLFDLGADPHESVDLAQGGEHADILARCEAKLRAVVNPERASERAFADQAELVERHGGRDAVLSRGDFGYTPAPGEQPQFD
jgi:choline-sulfatase